MEIKIDTDELLKCVSKVQSIIERKSNMPILSTILLTAGGSTLHISATDLEIEFQQEVPANVLQEGSVTISGRKLFEILKASKKTDFHIREKDNNWIFMSDDIARFNLACLPADEYPAFIEPEGMTLIEIEGMTLSEMINKTIYSVTREEAGFKLSGVFTEKVTQDGKIFLRMVATDGHRLSMIDRALVDPEALDLGSGVMIPKKGMNELNKLASEGGPVQIGLKDKNCVVKKGNVHLAIRLLDAKFPDYHAVIPTSEGHLIEVNRISLLEAMRKMLILSNERYRAVRITLENDTMELVSSSPDLGEAQENIRVEYKGERLEAGFNPQYFLDILQSMESEVAVLAFIDNSKPCVIKGEADEGFLGLVMPMRL
ncbi:MAG: DNA polymerase III subunit beta [Thermodesulfobacteriota bacterium]|nr:DNA polymerase III subunit beta [Thermodesulfobacteriota bacterium]